MILQQHQLVILLLALLLALRGRLEVGLSSLSLKLCFIFYYVYVIKYSDVLNRIWWLDEAATRRDVDGGCCGEEEGEKEEATVKYISKIE